MLYRRCNLLADYITAYVISIGTDESSLWLDHPPEFVKTPDSGKLPSWREEVDDLRRCRCVFLPSWAQFTRLRAGPARALSEHGVFE